MSTQHFDEFLLSASVKDLRRYWRAAEVSLPYRKMLMRWLLVQRPSVGHAFLCELFGVTCTPLSGQPLKPETSQVWEVRHSFDGALPTGSFAHAPSWHDAIALAVTQLALAERYFRQMD